MVNFGGRAGGAPRSGPLSTFPSFFFSPLCRTCVRVCVYVCDWVLKNRLRFSESGAGGGADRGEGGGARLEVGEDLSGTRCGGRRGRGARGSRAASEEEGGPREDPRARLLRPPGACPALGPGTCRARPGKPAETPGRTSCFASGPKRYCCF